MRSCKRVLRKAFRMRSYRKQAVGGGTFSQPTVKFCRSHLVPVFEIFSASNFQLGCPTGCLLRATSAPQSFVPPNKPPGFRFLAPLCASKVYSANALGIGAS